MIPKLEHPSWGPDGREGASPVSVGGAGGGTPGSEGGGWDSGLLGRTGQSQQLRYLGHRGFKSLDSHAPLNASPAEKPVLTERKGGLGVPSRDRNIGAPGQDTPGVSPHPLPGDSPDREPGKSFLGPPAKRPLGFLHCPSLLLVTSVTKNHSLPLVYYPFHGFPPRL